MCCVKYRAVRVCNCFFFHFWPCGTCMQLMLVYVYSSLKIKQYALYSFQFMTRFTPFCFDVHSIDAMHYARPDSPDAFIKNGLKRQKYTKWIMQTTSVDHVIETRLQKKIEKLLQFTSGRKNAKKSS